MLQNVIAATPVLADAVRLVQLPPTPAPSTNLIMNSFTADSQGNLWVRYTITGASAPQFNIGIYGSTDGRQPQTLLQSVPTDSADLGPGTYTFPLGLTLADLGSDGYYFAKLDPDDAVEETSKADNIGALSFPNTGSYQDSAGDLYVVTPNGSQTDTLVATQDLISGNVTIVANETTSVFQNVSNIDVMLQGSGGSVSAAGVTVPMTIYGGTGSGTIVGGDGGNAIYGGTAGGNTIYAGAGTDTIYGGGGVSGGQNTIYGGSGTDTIYAGDGGDTITGGTGNDEIYGGAGNDTITGGSGTNTIYAGSGNATITGGTGNNEIYGGAGNDTLDGSAGQNNWIQAGSGTTTIDGGSGNDWLYGGSGTNYIYAGSGTEVVHGGSGTNYIYGGTGLDDLYGGSGTNFIYGNGAHDLLQGGSGSNYILPTPDAIPGHLASIEVENPGNAVPYGDGEYKYSNPGDTPSDFTSDGNIDSSGNPVAVDYDPGYGGVWNFNDFDSGVRLGKGTVTPVAVYATWVPQSQWENDARYTITGTADGLPHQVDNINQTAPPGNDSPVPNDRPWKLLGVYDVNVGSTLTVTLCYDTHDGGEDPTHDAPLCVSDVMIQPLWPTVSIRPTNVTVNPKVAPANAGDYVDWFDACNPISVPVEDGQGDRTELQLAASINPLYAQIPNASMSDWQAALSITPTDSGLELWNSSTGGSAMTTAEFSALISSGDYDGTVWVSSSSAEDPTLSLMFANSVIGADVSANVAAQPQPAWVGGWTIYDNNQKLSDLDAISGVNGIIAEDLSTHKPKDYGFVSTAVQAHAARARALTTQFHFPSFEPNRTGQYTGVNNAFTQGNISVPKGTFTYSAAVFAIVADVRIGSPDDVVLSVDEVVQQSWFVNGQWNDQKPTHSHNNEPLPLGTFLPADFAINNQMIGKLARPLPSSAQYRIVMADTPFVVAMTSPAPKVTYPYNGIKKTITQTWTIKDKATGAKAWLKLQIEFGVGPDGKAIPLVITNIQEGWSWPVG